jgi:hypothetical protein
MAYGLIPQFLMAIEPALGCRNGATTWIADARRKSATSRAISPNQVITRSAALEKAVVGHGEGPACGGAALCVVFFIQCFLGNQYFPLRK